MSQRTAEPEWADDDDDDGGARGAGPSSSSAPPHAPPSECCVACQAASHERSDDEHGAASPLRPAAPLSRSARARKILRTRVLNFTPSWFSVK